jgi:hypothetical protein
MKTDKNNRSIRIAVRPAVCPSLAILLLSPIIANAAVLAVGDKIGIDFGATTTTNWNKIPTIVSTTIVAGSVVKLSGVVADGVTVATTFSGLPTNGFAATTAYTATPPTDFVANVLTDFVGYSGAFTYTITIGGLNNAFTYNLTGVTSADFAQAFNRQDRLTVTAATGGGTSTILRSNSNTNGAFHSFTGLTPTGGVISIALTDTSGNNNPIINGLVLTAIPEPSAALLGALGSLALLRRRR